MVHSNGTAAENVTAKNLLGNNGCRLRKGVIYNRYRRMKKAKEKTGLRGRSWSGVKTLDPRADRWGGRRRRDVGKSCLRSVRDSSFYMGDYILEDSSQEDPQGEEGE